LSIDLYGVSRGISAVTFTPVPLLIVASLWYLLFTSALMVGQHFIEKRFSRGTGRLKTGKGPASPDPTAASAAAVPGAAPGTVPGSAPGSPLGTDFGGKG
jgi:polar amino acid transport system permease protein